MIFAFPIVLLALVSSAAARLNLRRRGLPGAMYYCDETNFRGDCTWLQPNDGCHLQEPGYIKSFGPDANGVCVLYKDAKCTAGQEATTLHFPGMGSGLPVFSSFQCSAEKQATRSGPTDKALDPLDDGPARAKISAEEEEYLRNINRMNEDNFKGGFIGS
ncbi:hypothetical protein ACEQ8H_003706 [Pleosporales sp. CAS-2024a]